MSASASKPDPKTRKQAVLASALAWLGSLYDADGYQALEGAVADAIRSGMAEGEAGALAVAAARQGATGFAIDRAFADAYARLGNDPAIGQQAAVVAASMIRGAAAGLAVRLTPMLGDGEDDGSDEDEIAAAATATVTGGDVRSVTSWLSDTLWAATGTGALALYSQAAQSAAAGPLMVNWVTESGNPCVLCQQNEAGSPYFPSDVPAYLAHPNCRCLLDAATDIPPSLFAAYLLQ